MELKALRSERKASFWSKVIPYFSYVMQSGVAVLFLLLFIAFSAWYTAFLRNLPPDLPVLWIMLILLGPLTVHSGFRTYAHGADLIFLLPQESRMKEYLNPAYRSGIIYKLIGLYIVLITLWPLYIRGSVPTQPLWLMVIVLLLLKVLSGYGSWQELRITTARARAGYRILRWCFILLMLAAWLWQPAWQSALFMLLVSANYILALRFPMKHVVPWENMIATERAGAARVMRLLGWFVDVPAEGQKVSRRRYLSFLGNSIPWKRANAYQYLLVKTLLRSELLGIVTRLALLGMILSGWNRDSWVGSMIYVIFVFLTGTQLSALRHINQDSPAASFYPIPDGTRTRTVLTLTSNILFGLCVVMWLPMLLIPGGDIILKFATLAAGLLLTWALRATWSRKWSEQEEE